MKKLITALFCSLIGGVAFAQWTPASYEKKLNVASNIRSFYKLDINAIRNQLSLAQEMGANSKSVEISLPTLEGKIEKFAVYSFPVVVKELADQYQLGSYVGVGIDDPAKHVRFSVAPNDFQSMIIKNGQYEFIEPADESKTLYGVHPKTTDVGSKGFLCSMDEDILSKQQIAQLYNSKKSFSSNPSDFAKSSDKKYRTLRLAMSVTGEYTAYFGGTVAGALTAINATLTRVNGVFEKDMALHLILQNFPNIIYLNAATDPYSNATAAGMANWNVQLQQTLTANVGNDNYDIGHLFGKSGGGGNAGCIGCICVNPTSSTSKQKGSGYTSPANAIPQGDTFDIDYVAHEMGHQLGANHTFTHNLEGSGVNMEPGSGSTIMGYAGITNADVQSNSDPYFHVASLIQIQNNLISKTCDVETTVANNPPVITPFTNYLIPKSTAFVLTGNATDPEGNPMTYTWEQYDDSQIPVTVINGDTPTGPLFRSILPSGSPTRYFPKLATVLGGSLISLADWEAVSTVARGTNFMFTARDNNPTSTQQQTSSALQKIDVGNEGPFMVTSSTVYNNSAGAITWDVVGTNGNGYNVQNVKIEYTTNNGNSWVVISPSTPNDGAEGYSFSSLATGSNVKIRVSAIGNVFYAIGNATVAALSTTCSSSAATGVTVSGLTRFSANISWNALQGATYSLRYRKVGSTTWTTVAVSTNAYYISGLDESSQYEVQVANVCGSTIGAYSSSINFSTLSYLTCVNVTGSSDDEYISNVSVTPNGGSAISNPSSASTYTSYVNDPSKVITLSQGSMNNAISISKQWTGQNYNEGVAAWIDFNRDGNFTDSEMIMSSAPSTINPVSGTFSVPANAFTGQNLVMRVMLTYDSQPTSGCNAYAYGEIEDYPINILQVLSTSEVVKEMGIQIYPNPATDVLNITKVSNKAKFEIHNTVGQIVKAGEINNNQVRVSELTRGTYIITINDKDLSQSIKFIKK
ncbi:reprolysin-like metallopeptidase [Chryseobacterium sp. GP-SGM7]|uniref:reprolysin-like metallopeptidase n=1 Tax=Chryseobacterium sp. GP-SGM7 TaxID=3411323 RepID=UPI003B946D24